MIHLKRTNTQDTDFQMLVQALDRELAIRDGDEHDFYAQFNHITFLQEVVVAYKNNLPVGCGAIKYYSDGVVEIKRMYVPIEHRGSGIASVVLTELEKWATELNFKKCILETGLKQPEAIQLYQKNHYAIIPNYGQYEGVENSICFEKNILND